MHDVEPDGDLGEFDGGLVQVDAVAVVQGDVRLNLLQGEGALVRFEAVAGLFLAQAQVQGGELVDGLVEERAGAEGGLAYPPAQHLGRRDGAAFLLDPLLQGELHGHAGQGLRRVVGGAGLPVPAGQPVDERAGAVADPLAGREPVLVLLHDEHVVGVAGDLGRGDHPGAAGRVALLGDLVEFLGGDEPGVGHQPLVDRAELVDAELGVGDEPAALVLALPSRCPWRASAGAAPCTGPRPAAGCRAWALRRRSAGRGCGRSAGSSTARTGRP